MPMAAQGNPGSLGSNIGAKRDNSVLVKKQAVATTSFSPSVGVRNSGAQDH